MRINNFNMHKRVAIGNGDDENGSGVLTVTSASRVESCESGAGRAPCPIL